MHAPATKALLPPPFQPLAGGCCQTAGSQRRIVSSLRRAWKRVFLQANAILLSGHSSVRVSFILTAADESWRGTVRLLFNPALRVTVN